MTRARIPSAVTVRKTYRGRFVMHQNKHGYDHDTLQSYRNYRMTARVRSRTRRVAEGTASVRRHRVWQSGCT
jgi:hypothetical protein